MSPHLLIFSYTFFRIYPNTFSWFFAAIFCSIRSANICSTFQALFIISNNIFSDHKHILKHFLYHLLIFVTIATTFSYTSLRICSSLFLCMTHASATFSDTCSILSSGYGQTVSASSDERVTEIPGIRWPLINSSVILYPFNGSAYRPPVHSATYRCVAKNEVGTLVSKAVHLKAGMCAPLCFSACAEH